MAQGSYEQRPGLPPGILNRTYRIDRSLVIRLDNLSDAMRCPQSQLVEIFIAEGLRRVEEGQLQLEAEPVRFAVRVKP